jgi:enoyl-CoA hydratase/carnithine racemase
MIPLSFIYEERQNLALITLNRPEILNALTFEIFGELNDVFINLRHRHEIHAVILTGKGKAFCSGGDFNEIMKRLFTKGESSILKFNQQIARLFLSMRALKKPIIAAVNGIAAGDGASLALACDLRIASDKATFSFLHNKFALAGTGLGVSYLLPRVVGVGRAMELLLTGDTISAYDAERYGLVNRVVRNEELLPRTIEFAEKFFQNPPPSLGYTKEILYGELEMNLEQAMEKEVEIQTLCMESADFQEAYEAFVAKRPPEFQGR